MLCETAACWTVGPAPDYDSVGSVTCVDVYDVCCTGSDCLVACVVEEVIEEVVSDWPIGDGSVVHGAGYCDSAVCDDSVEF